MLTARQKSIYDFIVSYQTRNHYAPSIAEIREYLGVSSTSTVHKHLAAIERRGYLRRKPGLARGIEVVSETAEAAAAGRVSLPVAASLKDVSPGMDVSQFRMLPVARWLLPEDCGPAVLYQMPALELEKPWRSWSVIEYERPVPYEEQVLAGFVMDGKTSQIRWVERKKVVTIFRHRGAGGSYHVNESRIAFVGPVVARIQTMEREEVLSC